MKKTGKAFHGSDLEKIEDIYGIPKDRIVSFSANVNPLGFSPKAADALVNNLDIISRYPDRDYVQLREAISAYTGALPSHMILGNGVTELLTLFINIIAPKKAVIIGPTYSEYEKDLKRCGSEFSYIHATEENDFVLHAKDILAETPADTDLVILCNPNNPTSGALLKDDLELLAKEYQKTGTWLMIDETYAEFSPISDQISAADMTNQYDNLFVLRGTSKFFATPGLRLGYALTGNNALLDSAAKTQDPWNINAVADFIGSVMFTDVEYIQLVKNTVETEKDYICKELNSIPGLKTYPVYGNFVLVRLPEHSLSSGALFDMLIAKGMMIRDCATFPTLGDRYIRICFMGHEDNQRLIAAIKEALCP